MSTSLRAERALSVRSPAIPLFTGQPALVPLKLEGTEGVNSLFHYTLTLQTPDTLANSGTGSNFDLDSFIGLEITCSIELDGMGSFQPGMPGDHGTTHQGAGVREISGLITAARFVREDHRHAVYELEMRPWLYLTTLTTDYSQPNAGADKQAHRTEEQGRQLALLRMQHLRQGGSRAHGTGHVRGVVPGRTFTLSKHPHQRHHTLRAARHRGCQGRRHDALPTVQRRLRHPADTPRGNGRRHHAGLRRHRHGLRCHLDRVVHEVTLASSNSR